MSVSNSQGSDIDFPGLPGIFDKKYPKTSPGWLPGGAIPFSGVMAEAIQTVAVTSRNAATNLLALGNKGHAGYVKQFGGVDINIDAIMTDNAKISGAYGYQLSDFDNILGSGLVLYTTNGSVGKVETVSGIYVTQIAFNFNANGTSSTAWTFVADSVVHSGYLSNQPQVGERDFHCVNPLTWDEIYLFDGTNSVTLTGVQSASFTAQINRSEIFQIGQFTPYDRAVQYPYNVTVNINTLANDVQLLNWWDKFVPLYDPMTNCGGGLIVQVRTGPIASGSSQILLQSSGLRPVTSTLNAAVGSNSTLALSFAGTALNF